MGAGTLLIRRTARAFSLQHRALLKPEAAPLSPGRAPRCAALGRAGSCAWEQTLHTGMGRDGAVRARPACRVAAAASAGVFLWLCTGGTGTTPLTPRLPAELC